jgi:non-specific serine/threonine protein kinase
MNRELNIIVMPDGSFTPEWTDTKESLLKSTKLMQAQVFSSFTSDPDAWLLSLGFCDKQVALSPSLAFFRRFAGLFTRKLSRTPDLETLRHNTRITVSKDEIDQILDSAPMMTGAEYLNREMLFRVWETLGRAFARLIKSYDGTVEAFIKSYSPDVHLVGRVFFHLVENKDNNKPFAFLATYTTRVNRHGKSKHLPLKHAIKEYSDHSDKMLELLSTVHAAAEKSDLISELVETGELFYPLAWSAGEAFKFLKEISIYEESGILCRIPNWWKGRSAGVSLNISMGDAKPSFVGMDAILNFNAQLLLGDLKISEKEARRLLEESEGLAFIKNKWVAVDPEKLRQTLDAYEKAKKMMEEEGFSIKDALRMQLNPEKALDVSMEDADVTVSRGMWLESVIKKLCDPELTPRIKPGKGFKADLRRYQQKGLNWLVFLHSLNFGACLADDMGLGKTVQVLGFLSAVKSENRKKASLLIIPASLIFNWINEIEKFFPSLNYYVAHPEAQPKKKVNAKSEKALGRLDLVITTYALSQKYDWLVNYSWYYVILDEAQAIKNPGTKQTRAVKKLTAQNRIIMTGTPVENRLSDLWSLFDFLNPGLMGNKAEFGRFAKNLKNNPQGYSRLRRLISPYILRRLKTDKSVISDLPEKVEMKTYAHLSKKQVILYKNMIMELKETIAESEGIQRKGLVLASLMKFKQLCNHPDQFLGSGNYEEKESGKFARLREICETIYEKRERVLVFTQFKEITDPLCAFLEEIFQRKGLIIHGSVPVGKRKKIIEHFQGNEYVPFMVLSLKAGGVGLNLTRANHVIHFDRWWNPAVENQATDRAFRIGQKKNVVVHKFLTKGTIEEKIDKMLEDKRELSEKVVSSTGEAWITNMDNKELMDMFKLTL